MFDVLLSDPQRRLRDEVRAFAMPSIVGEALNAFGTPGQKEKSLKPLLAGRIVAAEALTESRGGGEPDTTFLSAGTRFSTDLSRA
ncbi:MAG TPA: hypothetical protein PK598_11735, partial [Thermoanaerobaculia bacterium]|nr:hypothetical protein [Thermoanaerobaculia bacterium]